MHTSDTHYPALLADIVRRALHEDIGDGDVTGEAVVPPDVQARGAFVARSPGVISGLGCIKEVFAQLSPDVRVEITAADGDRMQGGEAVARIRGSARPILAGERLALNLVGRLSGIATLTRRFVDAVAGTAVEILDTRKTTPLLRILERRAVAAGGGVNHRFNLNDQVMIKDNHLAALALATPDASPTELLVLAVRRARERFQGVVEVEVDRLNDVQPIAEAGPDIILLDNFKLHELRQAVRLLDESLGPKRPRLEASGGITIETVADVAATGVDRISVGALTHSAPSLDVALDLELVAS
jgi:nicotinate-nucleotide pyrophosphorylase (carboxylating)